MNLSFSTKFPVRKKGIAGKRTNFVEKIWTGFPTPFPCEEQLEDYESEYYEKFLNPHAPNGIYPRPKIHTIRRDEKLRWGKGKYIHFNVNSLTKGQHQFAPVIQCTGKERIKISYWQSLPKPLVMIGDTVINMKAIEQLAFNDGFDSVEDFFAWFDSDFEGWIIHWTPFRYEVSEIEVESEMVPDCSTSNDTVDALTYAIKSKHEEPLRNLNILKMGKAKKVKSGMYSEMPKVKLGKFTIAQMTDKDGEECIWIENTECGEGGQFDGRLIENDFEKMYDKHF